MFRNNFKPKIRAFFFIVTFNTEFSNCSMNNIIMINIIEKWPKNNSPPDSVLGKIKNRIIRISWVKIPESLFRA